MKINFNRDNITKYIIIGGIAVLTLVSGVKFSSDAKKESKPANTKDNKQYEMEYEPKDIEKEFVLDSDCTMSDEHTKTEPDDVYFAPEGYHVEGGYAVRNPYVIEDNNSLTEYTLNGITYKAPEGYYLKTLRDEDGKKVYAIRQVRYVHLASLVNEIGDDGVLYSHYVAPAGYTLENDPNSFGKMIAVRIVTEYTEPIIVENQKSIIKK